MLDLVIVGAGPYGLSIAAHAEKAGLSCKVIGYPMDFWKSKIPPNMFIRTLIEYTGLSDPDDKFTIKKYQAEKNIHLSYPLSRTTFVDYGLWFINQTNISIEQVLLSNLVYKKNFFELQTEDGNFLFSKNVVIAVGLTNAQYIPKSLSGFPELVSHTANYTNFNEFENQKVLVVGGGQSAWETAALLNKANATVELAYRRPRRLSVEKGMNAKQRELADKFYYFSNQKKLETRRQFEKPTVSDFLVPLVEGNVIQRPNTFIDSLVQTNNNRLKVTFNDKSSLVVDHLIAATGYRFNLNKLPFLTSIKQDIKANELGEPNVNESFKSSIPNLFFAGPSTASCHGPAFRFIAGVPRTSKAIVSELSSDQYVTNSFTKE